MLFRSKADSVELENSQKAINLTPPDLPKGEETEVNMEDTTKVKDSSTPPFGGHGSLVVYKVQLLSSDKKIPFDSDQLKNVKAPEEYIENGVYKYTSGEYSKFNDANELKKQLRKIGFKDAFVIVMQDGKRIPLK